MGASTLRSRSSRSSAASVSGASLTEVVFQAFAAYPAPPPPRWVVHARLQARRQEQDYQDWARGYLGEDDADARESGARSTNQLEGLEPVETLPMCKFSCLMYKNIYSGT